MSEESAGSLYADTPLAHIRPVGSHVEVMDEDGEAITVITWREALVSALVLTAAAMTAAEYSGLTEAEVKAELAEAKAELLRNSLFVSARDATVGESEPT